MKNLIILLVITLVIISTGCNDNTITEPIAFEQVDKNKTDLPDTYIEGTITLNSALNDPYPIGNSFFRIYGKIEYELRTIYSDPMPPVTQRYLSIKFQIDADIRYFCTVCSPNVTDELSGFINEVSESLVPVGRSTVSLLEKTFAIQGREDGMVLKVKFSIANDRIEVNAMWLALPSDIADATDNKQ